jgi:hypothetical protein
MIGQRIGDMADVGGDDIQDGRTSGPPITSLRASELRDVGSLVMVEQLMRGTYAHFWTGWFEIQCPDVPEPDDLLKYLPDDALIVRSGRRLHNLEILAEGPSWHALVVSGTGGGHIEVAAESYGTALSVGSTMCERIMGDHHDDGKLSVTTWRTTSLGAYATSQTKITTQPWSDIASNYPPATRTELDRLASMTLDAAGEPSGRLILWHGAPGTGKTHALRALLEAWSRWCRPELLIDSEAAFADPDYLFTLMTRDFDDERPWRLVVVEDADKFLRADARLRDNPALDRLLNVTEGILGESQRLLVLLTTNSQLSSLHPAIVRPGRCLAVTEFRRFSATEARTWLGQEATVRGAMTLAEMFQERGELDRIGELTEHATGQYL